MDIVQKLRLYLRAGFLALVVALCAGGPADAQMQQVLGVDQTGFGQPVPAFAVTVPQGWQTRGGIVWGSRDPCNSYGYDFSWAAMSPDQRYGVAILPSMRWMGQAASGARSCAVLQIGSARDAIAQMLRHLMPQAQLLDYRQRPDYLAELGLRGGQFDLGQGAYMKTHVDAGEGLFSYTDESGRQMRAVVGLGINVYETFMPGGGVMADMRFFQGESLPAWLAFAPDGQLDMAMSEQMRKSIQVNPAWMREIQKHQAKINADNRQTSANINAINRDTNNYISRLSREGHENRMAAMDRSNQAFNDMISDRERWRDTDGTQLVAPTGGENMWRLDNGDYVSTNNHNFNPLAETGQFGTQLQRWE